MAADWYTVTDTLGVSRWPAVQVEILFNLFFLLIVNIFKDSPLLKYQKFNLYLILYGGFRFFHEYGRGYPKVIFNFTGYQFFSLVLLVFGMAAFYLRYSKKTSLNIS